MSSDIDSIRPPRAVIVVGDFVLFARTPSTEEGGEHHADCEPVDPPLKPEEKAELLAIYYALPRL